MMIKRKTALLTAMEKLTAELRRAFISSEVISRRASATKSIHREATSGTCLMIALHHLNCKLPIHKWVSLTCIRDASQTFPGVSRVDQRWIAVPCAT